MRIAKEKNMGVRKRAVALAMNTPEFRALGHRLVDRIAHFLNSLPEPRAAPDETPTEVRNALQADRSRADKLPVRIPGMRVSIAAIAEA